MTDVAMNPRIRLSDALIALGREDEARGRYHCVPCNAPAVPAGLLVDVRDRPEFGDARFVCLTCASDLIRQETAEAEAAERDRLAAAGQIAEEDLNALRAERDARLVRTDWTQLADNRARIGEAMAAAYDAYRQACRDLVATARDTGVVGDWPSLPE